MSAEEQIWWHGVLPAGPFDCRSLPGEYLRDLEKDLAAAACAMARSACKDKGLAAKGPVLGILARLLVM